MTRKDESVIKDTKQILRGGSTLQGIQMLNLDELQRVLRENYPELYNQFWTSFNIAGNKYLAALRMIEQNATQLDIDEELYG